MGGNNCVQGSCVAQLCYSAGKGVPCWMETKTICQRSQREMETWQHQGKRASAPLLIQGAIQKWQNADTPTTALTLQPQAPIGTPASVLYH